MANAFVLITAELGSETDVIKGLKMIDEIKEAHSLWGLRYYRPD